MKGYHLRDKIAFFILLIGGINWGLVGLFQWDIFGPIFGFMSAPTRVIYVIIGLAAVYRFVMWARAKVSEQKR